MKRLNDRARINNYMAKHPDAKPAEIAQALKISRSVVYSARYSGKKESGHEESAAANTWQVSAIVSSPDPVNHPSHYTLGGIETIDFIEAKKLSFHLGNVVKYITRAEHKGNQLQDLQKALWYLEREIKRVQE